MAAIELAGALAVSPYVKLKPEEKLSRAVKDHLAAVLAPDVLAFHIGNERNGAAARSVQAACGVLPGVSDWLIQWTDGTRPLVGYVELKVHPNKLTPEQERFHKRALAAGAVVATLVCGRPAEDPRRMQEALDCLDKLLAEWRVPRRGQ